MQWLEVIIARLDHHGEYEWSNWPRYVGTWLAPPFTPDFLGKVDFSYAWLVPVMGIRHALGVLNSIGWGKDLWESVTPVKAIRVDLGVKKERLPNWVPNAVYDNWNTTQKVGIPKVPIYPDPYYLLTYVFLWSARVVFITIRYQYDLHLIATVF